MGFLNRKMRRELMKKGGPERILEEAHQVVEEEVHHNTCVTDFVFTCWVLHDKFGFGGKRLMKCLTEMEALAEAARDKKLIEKPTDIRAQLYEEVPELDGRFPTWTELDRIKESKRKVEKFLTEG